MNSSQTGSEHDTKRRWPRYHFNVPMRLIFPREGKLRIVSGTGKELNGGGVGVSSHVDMQLGDEVMVEFATPFLGLPIRVRATVRDRSGHFFGLEFTSGSRAEELEVALLRQTLVSYATQLSISRA
jgi:hypothetical protein